MDALMKRPVSTLVWSAIDALPADRAFSAKTIAAATGLEANLVSALLRRFTDRGQLAFVGLVGQQARGGLRASLYRKV